MHCQALIFGSSSLKLTQIFNVDDSLADFQPFSALIELTYYYYINELRNHSTTAWWNRSVAHAFHIE